MLANEKIVICSAIGNEVHGKHKPCDSRGSVSAEKLPVIFSEEMCTSSAKILGDVHSRACGSRNLWK
jgi:hypothetical protein